MELRDEVRSQFNKCHRLAKKYYDENNIAQARLEYLKCSQLLEQLAKLSAQDKRNDLLNRSKKFREIADGLQEGNIKVFTDGIQPSERDTVVTSDKEKQDEKRKNLILAEKPGIRFSDIAGLDTVKEHIKEAIVYPFKYPDEYKYFGVKPGGGILLYGPPGCGKTMLAAAAAGECDAAFINLKVSDIKDKYVGESEQNIKEVFNIARSQERAIIFFDEIDSLAGERSDSREGHEKSLVSELLAQMDGLEAKGSPVKHLVLAATNRPWDVDIALRRSGRFDNTVFISHPDQVARVKILEINLKDKPISQNLKLEELARKTKGFASAELSDMCQRVARIPLRERIVENKPRRQISMADFEQVLDGMKTVLTAWYISAVRELSHTDQQEMFKELIEAAKEFHE